MSSYINPAIQSTNQTPLEKERASIAKEKTEFMNLYVEMLKNQDPSSPMDMSQMANMSLSFKNTSNLLDIKDLLLTKLDKGPERLQDSAGLLGKKMIIPGNELELKTASDGLVKADLWYNFPKDVEKAKLIIQDQTGNTVAEISKLNTKSGVTHYKWNGELGVDGSANQSADEGKYTFKVTGTTSSGKEVSAETSHTKTIEDITKNTNGESVFGSNSQHYTKNQILGIVDQPNIMNIKA
ncbi:MAG: flagellar hook assembly protein FlgD [Candidatus Midichloriaceae bacterium]|jgi:flagellar hook assembly protein FlgD